MSSKSLYLWNTRYHGVPETIEQVRETFVRLSEGVEDESNIGFVLFAQRIQQYVEWHEKQLDPEIIAAFQGIGMRAVKHKAALLQVFLPSYAWLEAMRIVVESACGFHLVVYDDERTGMAFIPLKGKVLPSEQEDDWLEILEELDNPTFPQTKAQFKKHLMPKLDEMMHRHGFQFGKAPFLTDPIGYFRDCAIGRQYLVLDESDMGGGGYFRVEISASIVNDAVLSIYNKFSFMERGYIFTISIDLFDRSTSSKVGDDQELRLLLRKIEAAAFAQLLDQMQDLQSLDRMLNGSVEERLPPKTYNRAFYAPQRLIIARLAGNPKFEELVTELEGYVSFAGNDDARASEWPKLLKYLREEVQPITPNSDNIA